jgi:Asp-tRNA(Asn)/Glu-tRNA(Gln) amidotransferase B subunit
VRTSGWLQLVPQGADLAIAPAAGPNRLEAQATVFARNNVLIQTLSQKRRPLFHAGLRRDGAYPDMAAAEKNWLENLAVEVYVPVYDAGLLTGSRMMAEYFEEMARCDKGLPPKEIANWLLGEALRIMNVSNVEIGEFRKRVGPVEFCALVQASHGEINPNTAKSVLEEMYRTGRKAEAIIGERGLRQISDADQLEETIKQVLLANPQPVADYKAGKKQAVTFLVGQIMRATKGRANAKLVNEILTRRPAEM